MFKDTYIKNKKLSTHYVSKVFISGSPKFFALCWYPFGSREQWRPSFVAYSLTLHRLSLRCPCPVHWLNSFFKS